MAAATFGHFFESALIFFVMRGEEFKVFVERHKNDLPRTVYARAAGVHITTWYKWIKRCGATMHTELSTRNSEHAEIIRREYPHKSSYEIAEEYGIDASRVVKIAKSLGIEHTPETKLRLGRKVADARERGKVVKRTQEYRERARLTKKRMWSREYRRAFGGDRQKTKHQLRTLPKRAMRAKHHLISSYGYIQTTVTNLLWYDDKTLRHRLRWGEEYYIKKYGLKFEEAYE